MSRFVYATEEKNDCKVIYFSHLNGFSTGSEHGCVVSVDKYRER